MEYILFAVKLYINTFDSIVIGLEVFVYPTSIILKIKQNISTEGRKAAFYIQTKKMKLPFLSIITIIHTHYLSLLNIRNAWDSIFLFIACDTCWSFRSWT